MQGGLPLLSPKRCARARVNLAHHFRCPTKLLSIHPRPALPGCCRCLLGQLSLSIGNWCDFWLVSILGGSMDLMCAVRRTGPSEAWLCEVCSLSLEGLRSSFLAELHCQHKSPSRPCFSP